VTSGGSQTTLTTYQTGVASAKSTVDGLSTSLTTYNQAVRTAEASLEQAQATLALKQAPARPEDVAIAQAQVISAQTALDNTVLRAPASGTVTQVDIKLGEQATAMKEVFMLQNVNELHEEALVSEADIASVAPGQTIDNTFDAFGPDQHFSSTVLTVNPASTVISGVVNYKVTGDLKNIPNLKPGMTANMTILVAEKKNVLAVPSSAIINQDGNKIVKVIDDPKTKTYHSVEIQTGLEADGGLTEVLSGLSKDQQVVTYIKQ
jgi:RND family efflux transporter MFP subunit